MMSIKDFMILTKFNLSFTVTLSCLFGYVLHKNMIDINFLYPFCAVLLLALGVSALNQVQEHEEDALMSRTKHRPIAAKRISWKEGLIISSFLILISLFFIYKSLNFIGIFIFLFVIVVYNIFYTQAKKTTIYAGVYGAVLGVIPPLIGWVSAGGNIKDIGFLALALFYFIWQIPHFWLLNLKYYKDYEKANFPTIAQRFGVHVLERVTFIWLLLTLLAGLFLIPVFVKSSITIIGLLILVNIYTLYSIVKLMYTHNYLVTFIFINSYMLGVMILLMINALFVI